MPHERVSGCGRKLIGRTATLVAKDGRAYLSGPETCGSIWLCPVCAGKIAEGRRKDVEAACEAHTARGGAIYMAAFTIPHHRFQFARSLRVGVAEAWRRLIQGRAWKQAQQDFGIVGYARALEVTHGAAGWHPHLHVLFFTRDLSEFDAGGFAQWLHARWARAVERLGFGHASQRAFSFQRAARAASAGDYVAKWGCDSELTKAHLKRAGQGGASPWQLLDRAAAGDGGAAMLFREYAGAFKGARHLTWSVGLRDELGVGAEPSDDALARPEAFNKADVLGVFRAAVWQRLLRAGVVPAILDHAESGGWRAVIDYLVSQRLSIGAGQHGSQGLGGDPLSGVRCLD